MRAIILAGGKGERLRPFTDSCPKGMVKIEGKPILEYQIEWLKQYGIKEIIFACGYKNEIIRDYFKDGKDFSVQIDYSIEDEPLGRGGAIKKAWNTITDERAVIVMNGDVFTEMDLNKAINAHKEKQGIIATVCMFPYKSPYGIVRVDNFGLVTSFEEKRTLPYWVNGGIYIFEHALKAYLPENGDHELTTFPELALRGLLFGYKSLDYWKGIDTVKDMHEFALDKKHSMSSFRKVSETINPV